MRETGTGMGACVRYITGYIVVVSVSSLLFVRAHTPLAVVAL